MSATSAWVYTNVVTVYPAAVYDDWTNTETFGAPYLIDASWGEDRKRGRASTPGTSNDVGAENTENMTIYTECKYQGALVRIPERGDFIALGDTTAISIPADAGANEILNVHEDDMSFFGEDPDYKILT